MKFYYVGDFFLFFKLIRNPFHSLENSIKMNVNTTGIRRSYSGVVMKILSGT